MTTDDSGGTISIPAQEPTTATATTTTDASAPAAGSAGSAGSELMLAPPEPVQAIAPAQAETMVPIDDGEKAKLDQTIEAYVSALAQLDPHSAEFTKKVDSIHSMGDKEIRESADVSNRMLDRPVKAMGTGVFDKNAPVAQSLVELRRTVEDLDPSRQGFFAKKHLFGLIPFGDHLRDYFAKYQSAQSHINAILNALYRGQDELRQDNGSIEQEKQNLWESMGRLKQYAYMAGKLDSSLEATIAAVEATDPAKAKALREDALFYVRQKHQDILTQLAVDAQGYLALDLVRKNNIELIKGVDRATTTTISALRTAVIVSQALANQKLVLDQITALDTTTEDMIESTSALLKDQGEKIHEQAAGSTISVEKLQAAFENIYASIDAIDTYKVAALDNMKQTIDALSTEVTKAQSYLDRAQGGDAQQGPAAAPAAAPADPAADLTLPAPGTGS
jgi:uncharacterized protein YaaN involved in tellurite resistance